MTLGRFAMAITLVFAVVALVYALMTAEKGGPGNTPRQLEQVPVAGPGTEPEADGPDQPRGVEERLALEDAPMSATQEDGRGPLSYRRALGLLIGRVVEADGVPAPGLPLQLYGGGMWDLAPDILSMFEGPPPAIRALKDRGETDEAGRFRFEGVYPGSLHLLGIDLQGPRTTVRFLDRMPNAGETVDVGDLVLEPFAMLTGTVIDLDGAPVAKARVRASNLPALVFQFGAAEVHADTSILLKQRRTDEWQVLELPAWISDLIELLPVPETRTDEDGRFTLEAVPVGLATILVDCRGFVTKVHGPVSTGGAGGEQDLGEIRIDSGEALLGQVVDAAGHPVAGAEVLAGREVSLMQLGLVRPGDVTDRDGRFSVKALGDGPHLVAARGPGLIDWKVLSGQEPGMDHPIIRLDPTHDLTLSVLDGAGRPVKEPECLLRLGIEPAEVPVFSPPIRLAGRIKTQEDGTLLIARLGAAKYDLFIRGNGFATVREEVDLTAGPKTLRVTLEPEQSSTVRLVAAATAEPVEWAVVAANRDHDWQRRSFVPTSSARSNSRGEAVLTGLRDGEYRLQVEHPGYAVTGAVLSVPSDDLVVEMTRGGSLEGRVHAAGKPLDEPRFIIVEGGDGLMRFSLTDLDGRFEIDRIPPGTIRLELFRRFAHASPNDIAQELIESIRPERRLSAEIVEGETTTLDIDLLGSDVAGPTARLRGRLLVNGTPRANWSVTVFPGGNWGQRKSTKTSADGAFEFGEVPSGGARVQLERGGSVNRGWSDGHQVRTIQLAPNEVRELLFDLRTGGLRGRVVSHEVGSPVSGAQVEVSSGRPSLGLNEETTYSSVGALTDAAGEFSFPELPAGTYQIRIEAEGFAASLAGPVEVPFNAEPPPLEIRLNRGSIVEGVLLLPEGPNTSYIFLWIQDLEGRGFLANTDANAKTGAFKLENIAPGSYLLNIAAESGQFESIPLDVPLGGLSGLRLEARKKQPPPQKEELDQSGG